MTDLFCADNSCEKQEQLDLVEFMRSQTGAAGDGAPPRIDGRDESPAACSIESAKHL